MLLAVDTATTHASIALHDGHALRGECTWEAVNRHTVSLVPRIQQLLESSGVEIADLQALAVCIGPGSFTGVRIGVSAAKGLAAARHLPLIGVATLDILVAALPRSDRDLYAVFSAGRNRIGFARYTWDAEAWRPASQIAVVGWEDFAAQIHAPAIVAGEISPEGAQILRTMAHDIQIPPPAFRLRRAGFLADLARARLRDASSDKAMAVFDPATVLPLYAT